MPVIVKLKVHFKAFKRFFKEIYICNQRQAGPFWRKIRKLYRFLVKKQIRIRIRYNYFGSGSNLAKKFWIRIHNTALKIQRCGTLRLHTVSHPDILFCFPGQESSEGQKKKKMRRNWTPGENTRATWQTTPLGETNTKKQTRPCDAAFLGPNCWLTRGKVQNPPRRAMTERRLKTSSTTQRPEDREEKGRIFCLLLLSPVLLFNIHGLGLPSASDSVKAQEKSTKGELFAIQR